MNTVLSFKKGEPPIILINGKKLLETVDIKCHIPVDCHAMVEVKLNVADDFDFVSDDCTIILEPVLLPGYILEVTDLGDGRKAYRAVAEVPR